MSRALATAMSDAATSFTWVTPPAAPSTSALEMVCTESRISRLGRTASIWPRTLPRSVSAAMKRSSATASMRSARSRTWAADSSPVTYRARCPVRAHVAAVSRSRVDLPTPGSPASSRTAPGTKPPPRTRSSSGMPVGTARAEAMSTSPIRMAGVRLTDVAVVRARAAPTSSTVPQAWHSPQRPTHLGEVHPQSVQR